MLEMYLWSVVVAFILGFLGEFLANLKVEFKKFEPKPDPYDALRMKIQYIIIMCIPFFNVFVAAIVFLVGLSMPKENLEELLKRHG
jgi:H+/Cl- antiporter ClcA